jgi:poly-beta-1,6-N-acetyl-D-glucosamine synthase
MLAVISVFFVIVYLIVVVVLIMGWMKTDIMPVKNANIPFVSIIIAARNEAANIEQLLLDLKKQDYADGRFEVIIVNDHSSDNTCKIVRDFILKEDLSHFRVIDNNLTGKKAALDLGITLAIGEVVLLTDADCTMGRSWINAMVSGFHHRDTLMLIGPVEIVSKNDSWFEDFQTLEFMSLTGSTAGAAWWNMPIMCNGANLGFYRQVYVDLRNKLRGSSKVSGDDIFLMFALKKARPGSIRFVMNSKAVVSTFAMNNVAEFFNQRVRWASKSTTYDDQFALFTGAVIGGFNFLLLILTSLMVIPGYINTPIFMTMWSVKFVADFPLLYLVSRFSNNTKVLKYYPIVQIVYPFYVCLTLMWSVFLPFTWKNRKVS